MTTTGGCSNCDGDAACTPTPPTAVVLSRRLRDACDGGRASAPVVRRQGL